MPAPLSLRRLLSSLVLPFRNRIRSGPNQGRWWSLASGRYLKGTMEQARMELLALLLDEGDSFWDVGAHHGYVSLHASRCVGADGFVYAFEPSPYNLRYLRKHLSWNAAANIDLLPIALAGREGTARLGESGSSRSFSLGARGVVVDTACVPSLLREGGLRPSDVLKVDVEGAEGDVLESAAPHLHPSSVALVAIHSMDNYRRVKRALEAEGFTVLDSAGTRRLRDVDSGDWTDDPDVLAFGPEAEAPGAEVLELLEQI